MTFSRRGLLFSPYKLKRTYDYFSLPVTIPSQKQSKYSKLLKLGLKIFTKLKEFVTEVLFPEARINISPCEPHPELYDKSPVEDYPFFENPKPAKKRKKPPPETIVFEKKKKRRSKACQTEFLLSIKDFCPSFAFYRDKDKTAWLEALENEPTDWKDQNSAKVSRKVVRKVIRRNLHLEQCSEVNVFPLKPLKNQEPENFKEFEEVFMDFESCSKKNSETQETDSSEKSGHSFNPEIKEIESVSIISAFSSTKNDPESFQLPFENSDSQTFVQNYPSSVARSDLKTETLDQNAETTKKQSFPVSEPKKPASICDISTNPFLNTSLIPMVEVPYTFGLTQTPATIQKVQFSGFSQSINPVSPTKVPESKVQDIEMSMEPCKNTTLTNCSIQTPNMQKSCMFTQNNIEDLFKTPNVESSLPHNTGLEPPSKTPVLYPSLSQSSSLFQLPSFISPLIAGKPNASCFPSASGQSPLSTGSQAGPSPSGQFKLGKIFSSKGKK